MFCVDCGCLRVKYKSEDLNASYTSCNTKDGRESIMYCNNSLKMNNLAYKRKICDSNVSVFELREGNCCKTPTECNDCENYLSQKRCYEYDVYHELITTVIRNVQMKERSKF